jgi:hypothetical protein
VVDVDGAVVVVVGGAAAAGFALLLELLEVAERLAELAHQVGLVADDLIEVGGLGENALAAEIAKLAGEATVGDAHGVVLTSGLGEGVGAKLVGVAAVGTGDGGDKSQEAIDGPVGDGVVFEIVGDDLRGVEGIDDEVGDLLADGVEGRGGVLAGDVGISGALVQAGEDAGAPAGFVVALANGDEVSVGVGFGVGVVPSRVGACCTVSEVGGGAGLGLAGDVALVAGDAVQAPEDEGDALGEGLFEGGGGGEAGDGGGAVLLPGLGGFETWDDGGGGAEAVAGVVAAGGELASGGAWAGG